MQTPSASSPAQVTEETNADGYAGIHNPLPLVFPIPLGSLNDISAVYFAASLIQNKAKLIDKHVSDDGDQLKLQHLRDTPETDLFSIPVPAILERRATALLSVMHQSLDEWKTYHINTTFCDLRNNEDLRDSDWLDKIAWMPDGSINYGQTAEKMLRCDKMTDIEKYRLACTYCFEDIVRSMWSAVGNERLKCDLHQNDHRNPLLNYWYSMQFSNSSDTLHYTYRSYYSLQISTLKSLIAFSTHNFNAVEYLWKNLYLLKRLRKQNIIGDSKNPLYTWRVLIDLNASEFDIVIKTDGLRILRCFAKKPQFEEVAITIWRYMLNRIEDDATLAVGFFKILNDDSLYKTEHGASMIQKMWNYVPERLRPTVAN